MNRAPPVEDEARIQKAQRSTGEIRQYRVVGHRKSHAIRGCQRKKLIFAPVAELADAYGSGPYFRKEVQVRFLSGAPKNKALLLKCFIFIQSEGLVCNCRQAYVISSQSELYVTKASALYVFSFGLITYITS